MRAQMFINKKMDKKENHRFHKFSQIKKKTTNTNPS
jgi:hypothetical protein